MAEDVKKDKTDEGQGEVKLFKQEDIDRIVTERLAREKEKYKDYEDLKKAKAELETLKAKDLSDLEKEKAEKEALKKQLEQKDVELKQLGIENLKLSLLDQAGLPKSWVKRILGQTEDEIKVDIEELKKLLQEKGIKIGEGVGGEPKGLPDFDKMSQAEYEAWRNKK